MLLMRLPTEVPMRLLPIWLFSWVIVIGASVGVLYHAITGRVQETLFAAGMVGLVLYNTQKGSHLVI